MERALTTLTAAGRGVRDPGGDPIAKIEGLRHWNQALDFFILDARLGQPPPTLSAAVGGQHLTVLAPNLCRSCHFSTGGIYQTGHRSHTGGSAQIDHGIRQLGVSCSICTSTGAGNRDAGPYPGHPDRLAGPTSHVVRGDPTADPAPEQPSYRPDPLIQ